MFALLAGEETVLQGMFALLAGEETVLQGMFGSLTDIEKCYGMDTSVEKK
jgi:hypothetical protein